MLVRVSLTLLRSDRAHNIHSRVVLSKSVVAVKDEYGLISSILSLNLRFTFFSRNIGLVDSRSEGSSFTGELNKEISVLFRVITLRFASIFA